MKRKNIVIFFGIVCLFVFVMACGKKKDTKWQEDFYHAQSTINTFLDEVSKTYAFIEDTEKNFNESQDTESQKAILDSIEEKMNEEGLSDFSHDLLEKSLNKLSKQFTLSQYEDTFNSVKNDLNNAEVTKETLQNDVQSLQSVLENIDLKAEQWDSEEESNKYKNETNDLINQCNAKIAEIDKKAEEEAAAKAKAEEEKRKKEEERKKKEQQRQEENQQPTETATQSTTEETIPDYDDYQQLSDYVQQLEDNAKFKPGQLVHFKNVAGITGIVEYSSVDYDSMRLRYRVKNLSINVSNWVWWTCKHGYQNPKFPGTIGECVAGSGDHLAWKFQVDLDGNGVIEGIEQNFTYKSDEGYFFTSYALEDDMY